MALGFIGIVAGVSSRKIFKSNIFMTARNLIMSYFGVGLILAPEIFNSK